MPTDSGPDDLGNLPLDPDPVDLADFYRQCRAKLVALQGELKAMRRDYNRLSEMRPYNKEIYREQYNQARLAMAKKIKRECTWLKLEIMN